MKITPQQLQLLPPIANTATKFYKLNRVLIKQTQNKK